MPIVYDPPLNGVFAAGQPVAKGDVSALFGIVRDSVNTLELFLRDIGVWTITAVGGTANAITGTLGWPEDPDTVVLLIPLADNTGPVTLKLGSGPARGVQKPDSTGLAPGDLKQGQPVMLRVTAAGPWRIVASGVLWSMVAGAVEAEATARINATRDTGVLPLANVSGTANAITADIAPSVPGVTLSVLSTVELIPGADNTGPVTLAVGGAAPWPVYRRDGTDMQAGDIKTNQSVWLRRRSNTWRMVTSANSELATSFRGPQRRVYSIAVTVSGTGPGAVVTAKLPADVNPFFDSNTLVDLLWPDAPWPAASKDSITIEIQSSTGAVLHSRSARLDRASGPGPRPGAWWTIRVPPGGAGEWQHVAVEPTQADVDSRAKAADMTARFEASLLAHRRIVATRDAAVTGSLRLVLPEEPSSGERFTVVVPEDAPGPGLSIATPSRIRSAGMMPNAAATQPTGSGIQFKAGDILTLQVHDASWFRIHAYWASTRTVVDLQNRLKATEAEAAYLRANSEQVVEPVNGSWPARPAGVAYVKWMGPTTPGSRMLAGADTWVKTFAPTVPTIPLPAELQSLELAGQAGGRGVARLKTDLPRQYPALSGVQVQVDGGGWATLLTPPLAAGAQASLPVMAVGDHSLRFRYANYLGQGEQSPDRLYRAHGAAFEEDFSKQFAWSVAKTLKGRDNWRAPVVSAGSDDWTITSDGEVTASTTNNRSRILTSWDDLAGLGGAGLFVEGRVRRSAGATRDIGVCLSPQADSTNHIRLGKSSATWSLFVAGGTVATGPLDDPAKSEILARIEVSPDGLKIRAYVDGALVVEVDSPLAAGPVLYPGMYYYSPSPSSATGTATIGEFRAGRVAA